MGPERVVSGAQTGVDRAALDAAREAGLPCGGWAPLGRLAEDGRIPDRYPVRECESADYAVRTERNVLDSDATLILYEGKLDGGTAYTLELCRRHGKPAEALAIDRGGSAEAAAVAADFLRRVRPRILNVAGPRESGRPGIHSRALALLRRVFAEMC